MPNILPKRKTKTPKKELSREAKIWKGLAQPIWGMFAFTILPFIIMGVDYASRPIANLSVFLEVVSDWQGLMAGSFALLAAAFAARAVVLQISSAETAEQARLVEARALDERNTARELLAARSVMPLTLSVLGDYATAVARSAHDVVRQMPGDSTLARHFITMPSIPSAPASIIIDLQNLIRVAPAELGTAVADILADLQRVRTIAECSWLSSLIFRKRFETLIGRTAVFHARVEALYPYAIRQVEEVPAAPQESHVLVALELWFNGLEDHPEYVAAAKACLKKATSPAP